MATYSFPVIEQPHQPAASFLREKFAERKMANQRYSLSAFARDLGLSVSYLSRIMRGQRYLTVQQAIQLSSILGLSQSASTEILQRALSEAPKKAKISPKLREQLQKQAGGNSKSLPLDVEQFQAISQWYHLAILNLTFTKDFKSSPHWISRRLGITRIEAEVAIQRLIQLGLLRIENGKYVKTALHYMVQAKGTHAAIREFQRQTLKLSMEAMNDVRQVAFERRCMPGSTLAIDSKKLPVIREKIYQFQDELTQLAKSDSYDEVYQLHLHLFPLTKKL